MPNMQLYICKGIPTDKTYNHVLRFRSDSSRFAYFTSKSVLHLTNYTYQRLEHYLSVGVNAETIEPCNYIVFQNADFSDKWYYAFIDKVKYVANETSRIYFTVDVMQTWFNQVLVPSCFIERSHTNTDNVGDNLVPEDIETGPYVDYVVQSYNAQPKIAFLCTFNADYSPAPGTMKNGLYTGLQLHTFTNENDANAFLDGALNVLDGIVSCYMTCEDGEFTFNISYPKSVDGYVPKNKKLLTYPYSYCRVFDTTKKLNGVFRYELWRSANKQLKIIFTDGQGSPEIGVIPVEYGTRGLHNEAALQNAVYTRPYPTCAYNTDIYKAYMAQNASAVAVENLGMIGSGAKAAIGIAGMIGSTATLNFGEAVEQGIGAINEGLSIANTLAKRDDMDRLPPQTSGMPSTSLAYTIDRKIAIYISQRTVTKEFAEIIDNYWSVYGYPIHKVGTINIDSRINWNYVKTANCHCIGDVPSDVINIINTIFNRGVTFWHNPNTVGNYSQDNNIVG